MRSLPLVFLLLVVLSGCSSRATRSTRTTPVEPGRTTTAVRAALVGAGYSLAGHSGTEGKRKEPSDPDHAKKVAGALAINAVIVCFEVANAAATGHGSDFNNLFVEPKRSGHAHAIFHVRERPTGGSEIELRICGVPAKRQTIEHADELWAAVARQVPLDRQDPGDHGHAHDFDRPPRDR